MNMPMRFCCIACCTMLMIGLAGCSPEMTVAGKYHIEQDGYGFGPGAEKIILDLRTDKTFDVKAGPVVLVDGTWSIKDEHVTFSKGQGAIVVSYRPEGTKLLPVQGGKDVPGWRWAR